MLFGIHMAQQEKCGPIIIESYSKEVVELYMNMKSSITKIYWIIEEIQVGLVMGRDGMGFTNPSPVPYMQVG